MAKPENFGSRKNNDHRKGDIARRQTERRQAAEARQAAHQALSLEERLEKAKAAPGNSTKEIAKLQDAILVRDHNAAVEANKQKSKKKEKAV